MISVPTVTDDSSAEKEPKPELDDNLFVYVLCKLTTLNCSFSSILRHVFNAGYEKSCFSHMGFVSCLFESFEENERDDSTSRKTPTQPNSRRTHIGCALLHNDFHPINDLKRSENGRVLRQHRRKSITTHSSRFFVNFSPSKLLFELLGSPS